MLYWLALAVTMSTSEVNHDKGIFYFKFLVPVVRKKLWKGGNGIQL